jgi:hypothetical protein
MKRILSIFFFLFFALSVNSQTKSPLTFGDALAKNRKMQITGTVLTVVGGVTLFAGNLMYWKMYNENNNNNEPSQDKVDTSVHLMLGGLGLMAVGIPLLTIGKMKERNIKIEARLDNIKGHASIQGIGLKIKF